MENANNNSDRGDTQETIQMVKEVPSNVPRTQTELWTCPEDPRYQQINKTNWCWRMFVDYHHCRNLLGDSASQCNYFYRCYKSICPNEWHERWDQQLKDGTFPHDVSKDRQWKQFP